VTNQNMAWAFESDLKQILEQCEGIWGDLQDARIFITGGTGFIGCWLLEALKHANEHKNLGLQITVLTRGFAAFQKKVPHLASYSAFQFWEGNVSDFDSPEGLYTHVIHGATDASADLNENNPLQMFTTVIQGTRRTLDFAVEKKVRRVLFMSSGAVYGQQPWEMTNVAESWLGAPSSVDARSTYAEAKRAAEMLCAIYQKQFGLQIAVARIFALLGPYLSLGIHFAAGNFIRDAMSGKKVVVNGNGLPCRSYLYASDLTVWLLHMLVRAESCRPYNVGSDESISVKELAEKVSKTLADGQFEVLGATDKGWNPGRYVPDTQLINQELGLRKTVELDDAIYRTAIWNGWKAEKI
jgi:nucleoside-diphosphate-sugar epimerase